MNPSGSAVCLKELFRRNTSSSLLSATLTSCKGPAFAYCNLQGLQIHLLRRRLYGDGWGAAGEERLQSESWGQSCLVLHQESWLLDLHLSSVL